MEKRYKDRGQYFTNPRKYILRPFGHLKSHDNDLSTESCDLYPLCWLENSGGIHLPGLPWPGVCLPLVVSHCAERVLPKAPQYLYNNNISVFKDQCVMFRGNLLAEINFGFIIHCVFVTLE